MNQSANPFTIVQGAPYKSSAKVVQCDQTSAFASSIMLPSETTVTKANPASS